MILVYKDENSKWHLLKSLSKTGLTSISIKSHCGNGEGGEGISQVPDSYIDRICKDCQLVTETLK